MKPDGPEMSDRVTQSIFAAIDNGSYNIAKTLCSQQLQKYPNSSYYYALSSYILLLSGERDESIKKSKSLMEKIPSDPNALELLNIVFRKAGLYKESIEIYENACKKYPNLALIQSWFELSIKNFDMLSLQKSSMALVQNSPADKVRVNKLICSFNLLVASEMNKISKLHKLLFPKLGLKMMESLEPIYSNAQELFIYVKILLLNDKAEEAVSQIKAFLKNEQDLELQIILLNTLDQTEKWTDLYDTCSVILVENKFDDWDTWSYLIKAASHIGKLEEALKISQNYRSTRNSKLALLAISKYQQNQNLLHEHLLEYIEIFGGKPCCFSDLKGFTNSFHGDSFLLILETLLKRRHLDSKLPNNKLSLQEVTFLVNYMKFQALLKSDVVASPEFVAKNLNYYHASKHLLKVKEKTDYFIGNEFLLLVSKSILMLSSNCGDRTFEILKCIMILEKATKTDIHEFHLRLWLVRLYSLINCYSIAKLHFTILKVRFVQNDTLSPYLFSRIGSSFPTSETLKDISNAQDLYSNNQSETTYMLREAYEKNSFNKIKGFIEFGLRLNNSVTRYLNIFETMSIAKIMGNRILYEDSYDKIIKGYNLTFFSTASDKDLDERLSDNRDSNILWDFGTLEEDSAITELVFGPKRSHMFLNLMISKELLITRNTSQGTLKSLITSIRTAETSSEFTDIEKWELSLIAQLVSDILEKRGIESFDHLFNSKAQLMLGFEHTLDRSVPQLYYTVLNIAKSLTSIKLHYKDQIDERLNKSIAIKVKSIAKLAKDSRANLKSLHGQTVQKYQTRIIDWFKQEGQAYDVDIDFIKDTFENIKDSSNNLISSMIL